MGSATYESFSNIRVLPGGYVGVKSIVCFLAEMSELGVIPSSHQPPARSYGYVLNSWYWQISCVAEYFDVESNYPLICWRNGNLDTCVKFMILANLLGSSVHWFCGRQVDWPLRPCVNFMTFVNLLGSSVHCLRDQVSSDSVVDR